MFDDDDESFLLQATQAAKVEIVVRKEAGPVVFTRAEKEAVVTKPQPIKIEPAMAKLKVEPTVPHPAIAIARMIPLTSFALRWMNPWGWRKHKRLGS